MQGTGGGRTSETRAARGRRAYREWVAPRRRAFERAAGATYVAVLVCLAAQVVAELAMRSPYNPLRDAISDLGAVHCTPDDCSPLFWLLDASFVLLGASMVAGGICTHVSAPRPWWVSRMAAIMLTLGGVGMAVVGFVPEDWIFPVHVAGAIVGLLAANLGAALAGWALFEVREHRYTGIAAVVVGLTGVICAVIAVLVFGKVLLGLKGVGGGAERIAVEPMLAILILSGAGLLAGEDIAEKARRAALRVQRRAITARSPRHDGDSSRSSTENP